MRTRSIRSTGSYAYDNEGRLAVVSNSVFSAAYAYSDRGLDVGYTLTLTNGVSLKRALGRNAYRHELIRRVVNTTSTGCTNTLVYAYDDAGRRTARNADTFGYNARSEVTAASILSNAYTYAYDEIGSHTVSTVNSVETTYTANNLNQYSQISVPSVPSVENPSYDLDGNLLTNGVFSYSYDAENRLVAAYSNTVCIVSNAYDYMSRRVAKWTPSHATTFVYNGWNLVMEIHHSNIPPFQSSTNLYVWGKDLSGTMQGAGGVGGLLAVSLNGSWYFPCYDANGNITAYIDESGAVVAAYTYDAFGDTIAKSGSMADAFAHRFSTKYYDFEPGLYYYGYRFYSPSLHRWLNRDPIEEQGGSNLYAFCLNDGVNGWDLLGLKCPCAIESFELTVKGWTGSWPPFNRDRRGIKEIPY
jgi:RHS repeat-associated protein